MFAVIEELKSDAPTSSERKDGTNVSCAYVSRDGCYLDAYMPAYVSLGIPNRAEALTGTDQFFGKPYETDVQSFRPGSCFAHPEIGPESKCHRDIAVGIPRKVCDVFVEDEIIRRSSGRSLLFRFSHAIHLRRLDSFMSPAREKKSRSQNNGR